MCILIAWRQDKYKFSGVLQNQSKINKSDDLLSSSEKSSDPPTNSFSEP